MILGRGQGRGEGYDIPMQYRLVCACVKGVCVFFLFLVFFLFQTDVDEMLYSQPALRYHSRRHIK